MIKKPCATAILQCPASRSSEGSARPSIQAAQSTISIHVAVTWSGLPHPYTIPESAAGRDIPHVHQAGSQSCLYLSMQPSQCLISAGEPLPQPHHSCWADALVVGPPAPQPASLVVEIHAPVRPMSRPRRAAPDYILAFHHNSSLHAPHVYPRHAFFPSRGACRIMFITSPGALGRLRLGVYSLSSCASSLGSLRLSTSSR